MYSRVTVDSEYLPTINVGKVLGGEVSLLRVAGGAEIAGATWGRWMCVAKLARCGARGCLGEAAVRQAD
jgi:hypothetical protein